MDRVKKIFGVEDTQPDSADDPQVMGDGRDTAVGQNRRSGNKSSEETTTAENLFDGGLFGNISQLIINPTEMQKQIEAQLQEIMRQMEAAEQFPEDPVPDPSPRQLLCDDELKVDDFKRLMDHRQVPFISSSPGLQRSDRSKNKPTEDERVLDRIHGTVPVEPESGMLSKRHAIAPFMPPGHPRIDIWTPPGAGSGVGGRRMFQGIITTTVRRPDGSSETKKITYDKDGNQTTTIHTTDKQGDTQTKTFSGSQLKAGVTPPTKPAKTGLLNTARHLFVNSAGYTLPKNLW